MMNSNVCTANQKNYNQAMEYVNLTLERDTATKADNLLFLKFMIDSIGRDIETDKQMLEDDINFATKMVIDDNKIDRRFFFMLFSKDEDEKTILKRTEDTINAFNSEVDGMSCELVKDKDIIKMYNLFTNPAYIAYERTDDVYLSMSQIIATNS